MRHLGVAAVHHLRHQFPAEALRLTGVFKKVHCNVLPFNFRFTEFFPHIHSTAYNNQNSRVAGLVVIRFHFPKNIPKSLTSNPLSQIVISNPRLQPDTHFAVDMFPYKKTELFQKSGFKSKPPKKPGNTPLSGT